MRTLMLSWEYPPKNVGGLARHVYDLTKELASQGEEIFLLTCAAEGAPAEENINHIHISRVESLNLPSRDFTNWVLQLNFALLAKAIKLEEEYGPFDLIHAHDWLVAFAARTMKHAKNIPLLTTIHATEHGRNQGIHSDLQRYINDVEWWLTYESWQVIVCSQFMKGELKKIFQLPDNKIQVVPNGVDIDAFKTIATEFNRAQYASEQEKIVFFVGRLVQEKGLQVLLDAVPKILHYCPEAKFIIAGTGPHEEYLKKKAHMINKKDKIFFTGYIDDAVRNALYKNAHVAVFPSLYEPFGIVALEAMAAGIPVVVSDVGGFSEVVTHGIDGLKAYSGNPESLADNIILMLKNQNAVQVMKTNALNKVETYFTWPKIATQTRAIYQMILEEARHSKSLAAAQSEKRGWEVVKSH
ncbi:glycosyltransferase family 4 protein [Dehalobacterium formicoaceticum]|uniref:Glycosyltransferase family 4 protein n=1 Tax=Dehalobacterium formicoaceticum TaxID=51515 RepID=A0ABT1Y995_9FIRM|nr:glycosyltransferase family 4 protein [Dehalobacterium formicoaceticum]MCR6546685.1 glycosyltransferase family 4 protein [Dehalobacterium formicoaceticum]